MAANIFFLLFIALKITGKERFLRISLSVGLKLNLSLRSLTIAMFEVPKKKILNVAAGFYRLELSKTDQHWLASSPTPS